VFVAATSAEKPVAPTPAATPPAPTSINLDVQVDRVVFGTGESARQFELHTQLDKQLARVAHA